jgi:xylan 1,4-beta-xylosidase
VPEFLAWTKQNNVPVDFVSSHLYPTDPSVPVDRDGFFSVINGTAATVAQAGLPFTMTEFNSGLGIEGGQDLPYTAAFVVHQHLAFQSVTNLDTLSFWTFSDIFEEGGFVSAPYHDGFGMQTVYAVPKPVYRAFQLISQQPATAVPVTSSSPSTARPGSITVNTVDVTVSTSTAGSTTTVVALVTNFNTPNQPITTETISISFTNVQGTVPSSATLLLIDSTHAFAKPVWINASQPEYPSSAEIADELAASQFQPVQVPLTPSGTNTYAVSLTLEPQSVASITFAF